MIFYKYFWVRICALSARVTGARQRIEAPCRYQALGGNGYDMDSNVLEYVQIIVSLEFESEFGFHAPSIYNKNYFFISRLNIIHNLCKYMKTNILKKR